MFLLIYVMVTEVWKFYGSLTFRLEEQKWCTECQRGHNSGKDNEQQNL